MSMKIESLIGRVRNLRTPSPTVIRLLSVLDAPDPDMDEVISTVNQDAVLSAKLLGVCNSAYFGLAQPISSVDQGVLHLGFNEIHRLLMALGFGEIVGAKVPCYDMEAGTLWQHSLVTALLAPRVIASARTIQMETSVAYTAGLLHDIGKLVIGQLLDDKGREQIHQHVENQGVSLVEAERAVLGADHAGIGACLLQQWRIPKVIVDAVEHHHEPPENVVGLSHVVHVADAMAHQSGASPGWGSFAITVHESALTALRLTSANVEDLTISALDAQEKAAQQQAKGAPMRNARSSGHAVPALF